MKKIPLTKCAAVLSVASIALQTAASASADVWWGYDTAYSTEWTDVEMLYPDEAVVVSYQTTAGVQLQPDVVDAYTELAADPSKTAHNYVQDPLKGIFTKYPGSQAGQELPGGKDSFEYRIVSSDGRTSAGMTVVSDSGTILETTPVTFSLASLPAVSPDESSKWTGSANEAVRQTIIASNPYAGIQSYSADSIITGNLNYSASFDDGRVVGLAVIGPDYQVNYLSDSEIAAMNANGTGLVTQQGYFHNFKNVTETVDPTERGAISRRLRDGEKVYVNGVEVVGADSIDATVNSISIYINNMATVFPTSTDKVEWVGDWDFRGHGTKTAQVSRQLNTIQNGVWTRTWTVAQDYTHIYAKMEYSLANTGFTYNKPYYDAYIAGGSQRLATSDSGTASPYTIGSASYPVSATITGSALDYDTTDNRPQTITTASGDLYQLVGVASGSAAEKGSLGWGEGAHVTYQYAKVTKANVTEKKVGSVVVDYMIDGTTTSIAPTHTEKNKVEISTDTYEVTYLDGVESSRKLLSSTPTTVNYDTTSSSTRPAEITYNGKVYELVSDSGNTTGTVKEGTTQVIYYYKEKVDNPATNDDQSASGKTGGSAKVLPATSATIGLGLTGLGAGMLGLARLIKRRKK